ncbi:MAG: hypothetical protein KIT31_13050 [Deltaproteobacteria bacterium]|nr:hypothetical protein [Deltaproteobacteria bacterium]
MPRRYPGAAALLVIFATACKNERPPPPSNHAPATTITGSAASPADAPPADAAPSLTAEVRERASFRTVERAGAHELSDGAGRLKLTLPSKPTLDGIVVQQENVDAFHARAAAAGAVNVEVGLVTTLDGPLPGKTMDEMAQLPEELARASGGEIAVNEPITLAWVAARRYEIAGGTGAKKERLFGWNVLVAQSQFLLVTCVGPDTPASRTACEGIARSIALTPS